MHNKEKLMEKLIIEYKKKLNNALEMNAISRIPILASAIFEAWCNGSTIYFCGNGGSAGNAIHLANDFIYGAGKLNGVGLKVESLSANTAVITCLANDIGYDKIYSEQIKVKGESGDILIALSGSGNSSNIIEALSVANDKNMKTFAILGFDGGECKKIASFPIHFEIYDMQIAEDLQLIIGHMCMKWLAERKII